jgi:hypothetical protein
MFHDFSDLHVDTINQLLIEFVCEFVCGIVVWLEIALGRRREAVPAVSSTKPVMPYCHDTLFRSTSLTLWSNFNCYDSESIPDG